MKCVNVEIKARCSNPSIIRDILKSHGADFKGLDHQVDTYFRVHSGRLKLREGAIENALIFYQRENVQGPKQSGVMLFKTEPGSQLKDVLLCSLGALVVVDKQREIYFIDQVKFHLDVVKNLGTFVEIEAIDCDDSIGEQRLRGQCKYYLNLFGIKPCDLIACSYSDLLMQKNV